MGRNADADVAERRGSFGFGQLEYRAILVGTAVAGLLVVAGAVDVWIGGPLEWVQLIPSMAVVLLGVWGMFNSRVGASSIAAVGLALTIVSGKSTDSFGIRGVTAIALILLAVAVVAFAKRDSWKTLTLVTLAALAGPLWWDAVTGVRMAIATAGGTGLIGAMIMGVKGRLRREAQRSHSLFENAPIALLEQDWSAAYDWFERRRREGVTDMDDYLRRHPYHVPAVLEMVKIVSANGLGRDAFAIGPDHPDHLEGQRVDGESFEGYLKLLVDFYEGRLERDVVWHTAMEEGEATWAKIRTFPLPGPGPNVMVAAVDITDLKDAKAELEDLVRSKDRFVAAVSHELRTPLASVVGFMSELVTGGAVYDEEMRREMLELAWREAMEASDIIEDLLVAARAGIEGVTALHNRVDVAAEIERVAGVHELDTTAVTEADLPEVCGDAVRIRQVLRNLITNAHRYGGPRRRIECRVVGGSTLQIDVSDDGPDITDDQLNEVFEPYVRRHERLGIADSVGLGLTVARHLAALMGGSLDAFRADGETVFRFSLPLWGHCSTQSEAA